jgi:hypothetical protein
MLDIPGKPVFHIVIRALGMSLEGFGQQLDLLDFHGGFVYL